MQPLEVFLLFPSDWEEAGCVLLRTEILEEWVDCRGVSTAPCLRVTVNLTGSNQTALLHLDEELVLHALEVQVHSSQMTILDLKNSAFLLFAMFFSCARVAQIRNSPG